MATGKLTKAKVVSEIAQETQLGKKDVQAVFDALFELAKKQLGKKGPGEFTIPGVVKLRVVKKKATPARQGRNPATGEMITIAAKPARKAVRATVLKATKELA